MSGKSDTTKPAALLRVELPPGWLAKEGAIAAKAWAERMKREGNWDASAPVAGRPKPLAPAAAWVQEPAGVSKKTRLSIGDRVTENDSPAQRVWTVTDISDGKAQLETPDFTTRIRVTRVFCTGKQRRSGWSKVMEVESDV